MTSMTFDTVGSSSDVATEVVSSVLVVVVLVVLVATSFNSKIIFDSLSYKKWRLGSAEQLKNIYKIENEFNKLKNIADIRVGIATLKDKVFFVDDNKEIESETFIEIDSVIDDEEITFEIDNLDGLLVGGASLNVDDFYKIYNNM